MKPHSAKNKGRIFQQAVRDLLLEVFPELTKDDVRSTSMGAPGVDILLSTAAKKLFPFSVECKSRNAISVYAWLEQDNDQISNKRIVFAKGNHKEPVIIMYAKDFLAMLKENNEIKNNKN